MGLFRCLSPGKPRSPPSIPCLQFFIQYLVGQNELHCISQGAAIRRVDIQGSIPSYLEQTGRMRTNDRTPAGHGFNNQLQIFSCFQGADKKIKGKMQGGQAGPNNFFLIWAKKLIWSPRNGSDPILGQAWVMLDFILDKQRNRQEMSGVFDSSGKKRS